MSGSKQINVCQDYGYTDNKPTWSNNYIWPVLKEIISRYEFIDKRAFEIGCGNGATANMLNGLGFIVTGIDPSESGIQMAKQAFPNLNLNLGDAYEDLAGKYGTYPLVVSLEVIEHCFEPRKYVCAFYDLLESEGVGIISTPYHGYLKNMALSIANKWDHHLSPLWDGGHIKFFSENTLRTLLIEAGFKKVSFVRVGRIPSLAKSMIAIVEK